MSSRYHSGMAESPRPVEYEIPRKPRESIRLPTLHRF